MRVRVHEAGRQHLTGGIDALARLTAVHGAQGDDAAVLDRQAAGVGRRAGAIDDARVFDQQVVHGGGSDQMWYRSSTVGMKSFISVMRLPAMRQASPSATRRCS